MELRRGWREDTWLSTKIYDMMLTKSRASTYQSHDPASHPRETKNTHKALSACSDRNHMLCCHSWFDLSTKMWMQTVCFCNVCHSDRKRTLCFLTFSGLSDEASTKDWEKCTIPTFLFSQNLWHQELGEVFRQSSYSPTGYNTTGQWGKRGERDTVKESEESEKGTMTRLTSR